MSGQDRAGWRSRGCWRSWQRNVVQMSRDTVLYEREHAEALIERSLSLAVAGESTSLFLAGDAGLGKTTLINKAISLAREMGFLVGSAACSEVDSLLPFVMIDRLFAGFKAELSDVNVQASSWDVLAARYVELVDWMRRDKQAPLLLVVDDLQWSDPDSCALLAALCRRMGNLPIFILAATRGWPSRSIELARLLVVDGFATLERLQPLSEQATRALLLEKVGHELPDAVVSRAYGSCAGNPLLLAEVADGWERGEDLLAGSKPLSDRIFLPRFAGVGQHALRWARGASVLGTRFHPPQVDLLLGTDEGVTYELLEALCDAGIMRGVPGGDAEFVHPLLCQALYEDMALPVRRGLHARAFHMMKQRGMLPALAATHALAAELKDDVSAVAACLEAARDALANGAAAVATEYFSGAVTLGGNAVEPTVWLELGQAAFAAGMMDKAESAFRHFLTLDISDGFLRTEALRLLSQVLFALADLDGAENVSKKASDLALGFDPALAIDIALDGAFVNWIYNGPQLARSFTNRAAAIISEREITDSKLTTAVAAADASLNCVQGDSSGIECVRSLADDELENLEIGLARSPWTWDPIFAWFYVMKMLEKFDEYASYYSLVSQVSRPLGAEWVKWSYSVNHADVLWRIGRLKESYEILSDAVGVSDLFPGLLPFAAIGMAHVCHESGFHEEKVRWTQRIESMLVQMGDIPYVRIWLLYHECSTALSSGRVARAVDVAERLRELSDKTQILEPCLIPWYASAIEAFTAGGRLDEAWELTDFLDHLCESLSCQAPRAVVLSGRAGIEWRRGNLESADELYNRALLHNEAVQMPLAHAETLIFYGRFLRHGGDLPKARKVLGRALQILEPTGAGRLLNIAGQELAVAGGQPRRAYGRSQELTAQERRVATIAANGLTNKEIAEHLYVSVKTVDHHLSSIYRKLGVNSRRELMLIWREEAPRES